jgi:hypothetical protein
MTSETLPLLLPPYFLFDVAVFDALIWCEGRFSILKQQPIVQSVRVVLTTIQSINSFVVMLDQLRR